MHNGDLWDFPLLPRDAYDEDALTHAELLGYAAQHKQQCRTALPYGVAYQSLSNEQHYINDQGAEYTSSELPPPREPLAALHSPTGSPRFHHRLMQDSPSRPCEGTPGPTIAIPLDMNLGCPPASEPSLNFSFGQAEPWSPVHGHGSASLLETLVNEEPAPEDPLPEHSSMLRKFMSFVEHMAIEEKFGRLGAAEATQVLVHAVPAALENCENLPCLVRALRNSGWTDAGFSRPISATTLAHQLQQEASMLCEPEMSSSSKGKQENARGRVKGSKREKGGKHKDMTIEQIRPFFHLNIEDAAMSLGIGLTMLKRRCRALGIPRWPKRKLDSVSNLGGNLSSLVTQTTLDENVSEEEQKEKVEIGYQVCKTMHDEILTNPGTAFDKHFTLLRQQCFKLKYKTKRGHHKVSCETEDGSNKKQRLQIEEDSAADNPALQRTTSMASSKSVESGKLAPPSPSFTADLATAVISDEEAGNSGNAPLTRSKQDIIYMSLLDEGKLNFIAD